jgi:ribosomal protein L11 methyltransferase
MRTWTAVDVAVPAPAAEAVEYAFNTVDCTGTEIDELKNKGREPVCVVGYFEEPPNMALIRSALVEALAIYGLDASSLISVSSRSVREVDWLAEWKRHWQPTEVGPFLVAPPWAEIGDTEKIVVRIEPNMAFGTGTHATTQLCLRAIGTYFHEGMSMLDVGTGTGILAIAAAMLSPRSKVLACDVDPAATHIARQNAEANGVALRVEIFDGPVENTTPMADLVCANLTLDVIRPMLQDLIAHARQVLVLSGILREQEAAIRNELAKFDVLNCEVHTSGEWLAVLIKRS